MVFTEKNDTIINYMFVFIAWNVAIVIHEMGHVIFGLKSSLKFVEFSAMFLSIIKVEDRIVIKENKDWRKMGGIVTFVPGFTTINLIDRWKLFIAGGPIFSLIFGVSFLLISWVYSLFFINILGYMSIAIGIITLIPTSTSDGGVYMMLQKKGANAKGYLLNMLLIKEFFTPRRPSFWPKQIVEQCQQLLNNESAKNDSHFNLRLPLYYYYYDAGKISEAVEILKPINLLDKKNLKNNTQNSIIYSLYITHQSLRNKEVLNYDSSVIESLYETEPYSYYRTKAAIEVKNKEYKIAFEYLNQARVFFDRWSSDYGYAFVEADLLNLVNKSISTNSDKNKKTH